MALDKTTLKASIQQALYDSKASGDTIPQLAQALADAIDTFVRSGTVTTNVTVASVSGVQPGTGVSGPGSGTGTGSIT